MKLSYKTKRKLALVVLLIWLPAYIVIAAPLLSMLPQDLNIVFKTIIYVAVAFLWIAPFKFVFQGVGRADPDAPKTDE